MNIARTMIPSPRGSTSILIATPNAILRRRLGDGLRKLTTVEEAGTGAEALSMLERRSTRIVLLDRMLPDLHCDELIGVIESRFPYTDVVLLDGESGEIDVPEELRGHEAYRWFLEFNSTLPQASRVAGALPAAGTEAAVFTPLPGMVGTNPVMLQLASLVRAVASHSTAVLITGETGSGKELVAEAVHKLSPRADKPFVIVNCAAIPESLMEAELFGHTRGAFTGAVQSRLGKIHAAQGGTIFFDEIGELPLASQAKLLRFLESGEVQRLGTSDVFRLDARVVAATNVDLEARVQQRLFRDDLFYRLSVFPIELPPLRARGADIVLLARHFIGQLTGDPRNHLTPESEAKLASHSWPGNVRELRNVMERAFVLSAGSTLITPEQILVRKLYAPVRAPAESS
jgi:DNA-binding NtrC family response regulator